MYRSVLLATLLGCLFLPVARAEVSEPPVREVHIIMDGIRYEDFWTYCPRVVSELVPRGTFFNNMWIEPMPSGYRTATTWAHVGALGGINDSLGGPLGINGQTPPLNPMLHHVLIGDYAWPPSWCAVIGGKKRAVDCLKWTSDPAYAGIEPYWETTARNPPPDPPDQWVDGRDELTITAAKDHILVADPRFLVLNLGWADHAGHTALGSLTYYTDAASNQDSLVANFVAWVESLPSYAGRTIFFIWSDHGRDCPPDFMEHTGDICSQHVFLLVFGPNIAAGVISTAYHYQTDIAPTAAAMLQVAFPRSLDGNEIVELTAAMTSVALGSSDWTDATRRLEVYDVQGRKLSSVRAAVLDGRIVLTPEVTTGIYFVRPVGSDAETKKVVIVR